MNARLIICPGAHQITVVEREGANDPVETLVTDGPPASIALTPEKTITIQVTSAVSELGTAQQAIEWALNHAGIDETHTFLSMWRAGDLNGEWGGYLEWLQTQDPA